MIEVIIEKYEVEKLPMPELYVKNKLIKAGIPITSFFKPFSEVKTGTLTKHTMTDTVTKYSWSPK